MANVRAAFQAQQAAARMWEYRFLNYFFAPATQAVLDWLISLGAPTTFDAYDTYWLNRIPAANERQAVIDALQMHHCIQFDAPTIVATDKGREYAGWHERRVIGAPAWALPGANERR